MSGGAGWKKRKRVSGIKHHVILLGERISLKPANENKPVAAIFIIVIIIIIFFLSLAGSEWVDKKLWVTVFP